MLVAIVAKDKPGALELRKATRSDHFSYLQENDMVVQAGPFLDEAGEMCGSLLILDVDNVEAAEEWAANDPYVRAGLFESVSIQAWKRVIGE